MKVGRFTGAAQELVKHLIAIEPLALAEEAETTSLSVKVNVSTASLLAVISEAFGQSRFAFAGEILDDFAADLFYSLPEDRRAIFAEKADLLTTEAYAKKGITVESGGPAGNIQGDQTWRMMNAVRSNFAEVGQC